MTTTKAPERKLERVLRRNGGARTALTMGAEAVSSRDPSVRYQVVGHRIRNGDPAGDRFYVLCTCPGYSARVHCWHATEMLDLLAVEPDHNLPAAKTPCRECNQTGAYGAERLCGGCRE